MAINVLEQLLKRIKGLKRIELEMLYVAGLLKRDIDRIFFKD